MSTQKFYEGDTIEVFETGTSVDEGVVTSIEGCYLTMKTFDNKERHFVHLSDWKHLFSDPFTGEECFSQRSKPIELRLKD